MEKAQKHIRYQNRPLNSARWGSQTPRGGKDHPGGLISESQETRRAEIESRLDRTFKSSPRYYLFGEISGRARGARAIWEPKKWLLSIPHSRPAQKIPLRQRAVRRTASGGLVGSERLLSSGPGSQEAFCAAGIAVPGAWGLQNLLKSGYPMPRAKTIPATSSAT